MSWRRSRRGGVDVRMCACVCVEACRGVVVQLCRSGGVDVRV